MKRKKPCVEGHWYRDKQGYCRRKYKGKPEAAHRVAYVEANGLTLADIEGQLIRHTCDNPSCVEPTHLVLGDWQSNMDDKVERDRQPKGSEIKRARLTEKDIPVIRKRIAAGEYDRAIAADYAIAPMAVWSIRKGRTWKHV